MSEVDPQLIKRYREAVYRVCDANSRMEFRVENENPELDQLLDARGIQTAAFLTAHNPGSRVLSPAANHLAHQELLKELADNGLCWLAGEGADVTGEWLAETSVMVFGIDHSAATALAKQFGQNAYIWIQRGETPHLVLTRCRTP